MEIFDIILDSDGELQELNGDFLTGDGSNEILSYLIQANKGEYKEFPLVGVGINLYLNGNKNIQQIQRDIKLQLKADAFPNPDVDLSDFPSTIKVNKTVIAVE